MSIAPLAKFPSTNQFNKIYLKTTKNTFFPFAFVETFDVAAGFLSNKLLYIVWYTDGDSVAVFPFGVGRSGGFPLTPPGTYSLVTAKYPEATSLGSGVACWPSLSFSWLLFLRFRTSSAETKSLSSSVGRRTGPGSGSLKTVGKDM